MAGGASRVPKCDFDFNTVISSPSRDVFSFINLLRVGLCLSQTQESTQVPIITFAMGFEFTPEYKFIKSIKSIVSQDWTPGSPYPLHLSGPVVAA